MKEKSTHDGNKSKIISSYMIITLTNKKSVTTITINTTTITTTTTTTTTTTSLFLRCHVRGIVHVSHCPSNNINNERILC